MTRANTLPTMLRREMPLKFLQSFLSPLFLYMVMILESLFSLSALAKDCVQWEQ